jgi:hypothetical protein
MRPDGVLVMAEVLGTLAGAAGFDFRPREGTFLVWPWARGPEVVANKRTIMKNVICFKVLSPNAAVSS